MIWLLQLKTILRNLVLPPAGPLLLALLGVILLRRRPRLGRTCILVGIGALWLLATPLIADLLTQMAERFPPFDSSDAASAQAIVILGGGGQRAVAPEYSAPAADPYLLERLSYGAYLARNTGLPVLVTGFGVEARAMRETLHRNFEIDAHWVDDQAYDTFQNARNSVRLLKADGVQRIILVTRATHMPRSVQEFSAAGIEVLAAPVGMMPKRIWTVFTFLPNPETLLRSYMAIYELVGEPVRWALSASGLRRQR